MEQADIQPYFFSSSPPHHSPSIRTSWNHMPGPGQWQAELLRLAIGAEQVLHSYTSEQVTNSPDSLNVVVGLASVEVSQVDVIIVSRCHPGKFSPAPSYQHTPCSSALTDRSDYRPVSLNLCASTLMALHGRPNSIHATTTWISQQHGPHPANLDSMLLQPS